MNKNLEQFGISDDLYLLSKETEKELQGKFKELDSLCEYNSLKVLNAFQKHSVTVHILHLLRVTVMVI